MAEDKSDYVENAMLSSLDYAVIRANVYGFSEDAIEHLCIIAFVLYRIAVELPKKNLSIQNTAHLLHHTERDSGYWARQ